jgi:hypothetical protein
MPKGETSRPYDAQLKNIAKGEGTFRRTAKSLSSAEENNRKIAKTIGSMDRDLNVTVNDAKGLRKVGKFTGKTTYPATPK